MPIFGQEEPQVVEVHGRALRECGYVRWFFPMKE